MRRRAYPWALAALLAACGGTGGADEPAAEPDTAAAAEPGAIEPGGVRSDSVPAAIVGEAPPPRGEEVRYWAADSATVGYLAVPEGTGPHPSVVLIHEWNGLVDRVRQVADAMADEGYVALAADLYQGRTGSNREENMALVRETRADPQRIVANLDAAAAFVREREDTSDGVAAIGWCFGGGVALSYALGGERHQGTAIFYGNLVTDPDSLAAIDHEIYGTFAEMDEGIPPERVDAFVEALRAAGVPNDVHVYDDVNHGFWLWVDEKPDVRLEPAADAWGRLLAYLERTLGP